MSRNAGGRLGRAAQWGDVLGPVVGVIGIVVAVWLAYQSSAEVRASVTNLVERIGPLVAGAVAVLALGGAAVVVRKVWRPLVARVVGPLKWVGGLGRRFYLWVLRERGPSRQAVPDGASARREPGTSGAPMEWPCDTRLHRSPAGAEGGPVPRGEGPAASQPEVAIGRAEAEEWLQKLDGVGWDGLSLLDEVLRFGPPVDGEVLLFWPQEVRLEPRPGGACGGMDRLAEACRDLWEHGVISGYSVDEREMQRVHVTVRLPRADRAWQRVMWEGIGRERSKRWDPPRGEKE